MESFEIAKLIVEMNADSKILHSRTRPYLTHKGKTADIILNLDEELFIKKHEQYPNLSMDECKYMWTGEAFYRHILDFDGLLLHSSCVQKGKYAYLFSANSGIGKSTHTHLWLQEFKDCIMINDDKPAIRKINGKFMACGTPFSGKNDESFKTEIPARAIVFLERAEKNTVEHITTKQAIPLFLSQTIRPTSPKYMDKLLSLLDEILREVPIFRLKCNMSADAAHTAFNLIEKYIEGDKNEN